MEEREPSGWADRDSRDGRADALDCHWLGRTGYRDAWDLQHRLVEARTAGLIGDQLLLLEHDPVLTLGKYADEAHVLATPGELECRGIEVLRVERGGEVTYHGPGQLVAYPILGLSRRGLLLRPLVGALEAAMIATCEGFGVEAERRDGHPGCWCAADSAAPRKIGALGIRVQRGVTFHGIALNVAPDLADFDLIDPCGMPGITSTSIAVEIGQSDALPSTAEVGRAATLFARAFASELGIDLIGDLPPAADPARSRRGLEALLAQLAAASADSAAADSAPTAHAGPATDLRQPVRA